MAPKAAPTEMAYTINGVILSGSDIKLFCAALSSLTSPIMVDMDAAAAGGGYTVGSFKKMWPTLRKKCHMDTVAGTKPASAAGDDGDEPALTPKKTSGSGAHGHGRSAKKAVADTITMGDDGPSPLTPGVPGLDALSMADSFATPDNSSKSTFGDNTVSSKKRTAANAEDPNDATATEQDTPAKKKKRTSTPHKPRVTAKQKKEAKVAAAAAALAEESAYFYEDEQVSEPTEAASTSDSIVVAMKDDVSNSQAEETATNAGEV